MPLPSGVWVTTTMVVMTTMLWVVLAMVVLVMRKGGSTWDEMSSDDGCFVYVCVFLDVVSCGPYKKCVCDVAPGGSKKKHRVFCKR